MLQELSPMTMMHEQDISRIGAPPELLSGESVIGDFFISAPFQAVLTSEFLEPYKDSQPEWGPVGYITYKRTYARPLYPTDFNYPEDLYNPDIPLRNEEFWETCTRVINGLWHILRCHSARKHIEFSEATAARKAEAMFKRMWAFKWLPPGRGLWMMGTRFMYRKGSAALNNCLAGETRVITQAGNKPIAELVGEHELLSRNGKWVKSQIKLYGPQKLYRITLQKTLAYKHIYATADHKWYVYQAQGHLDNPIRTTLTLKIGDVLEAAQTPGPHGDHPMAWRVFLVEETDRVEDVYCAEVPDTNCFALEDYILTGNCGFTSTDKIDKEYSEPFTWAMDMSMLGVGIGFDTKGSNLIEVKLPSNLLPLEEASFDEDSCYKPAHRLKQTQSSLPAMKADEPEEEYAARIQLEFSGLLPRNTSSTSYNISTTTLFDLQDKVYIRRSFIILNPNYKDHKTFIVPDSREGWVESVGILIDAFLKGKPLPIFDYSEIRPKGSPIRGFGGIAEGHQFLQECHENLVCFFLDRIGKRLNEADIVDIFNAIGACVVSGNVRRSAQISLGSADNEDFISLKHDNINHPDCWNSNNSIFASVGMDYSRISELIVERGEPGLFWLDNVRAYGRMGDPKNNKDEKAAGTNPCSEQTLHDKELCCLVESFPGRHDEEQDFMTTLKQAYLYSKTVTLVPSHSKKTNKVLGKNSRIGCSMSGIQQARVKFGTRRFLNMADQGYKYIQARDINYSDWLQVRQSIKTTSIKPSGTISLLPGVFSGIHYPIERTFLRRIRFSSSNPYLSALQAAGYRIYPAPEQPDSTVCVDFPIKEVYADRLEREVSIWEQLEFVAALQDVWADNQVSVTIKFDPKQPNIKDEIKRALELYEHRLKSVSFLPISASDAGYEAAPYEAISDDRYYQEIAKLRPYKLNEVTDDLLQESCDTGACPIR